MKRSIALMFVLLLVTSALATESFSPYDYKYGHAGSNHLYYGFPDVCIYMPVEWEGRITAIRSESGVSFYQTASYEKYAEEDLENGGFLFELCASEDESFRELPAYEYLGFSENAGLHFYLAVPSDYPAYTDDGAIRAEYDEMHSQLDEIVKEAEIRKNYSFYTDGLESTDPGMS